MSARSYLLALLLVSCAAGCKLSCPFSGRGFAGELMEHGYRAVSIPINAYELRRIRAGDRVDVLATFESARFESKGMVTATMLQNVKVLGVERPGKGEEKGTLVLKLNPIEAQFAALGVRQSDLSLALRSAGDNDVYPMEIVSFLRFFR